MDDAARVADSLERAGAVCADPTPLVYDRLFAADPALEELFVMDTDGGVRGSMLQTAFECVLDAAGGGSFSPVIVGAERDNHDAYGVSGPVFETFFACVRDTVRALNGAAWDAETDAAWARALDRLAAPR